MHSASTAAAILEETDELFAANLELIQRALPGLYAKLTAVQTVHSTLVRVGEDDWDVEFRGARFFGQGSRAYARDQIADFLAAPTRLGINPMSTAQVDRFTNTLLIPMVKRCQAEGINFNYNATIPQGWHLILFGWGLGDHVLDLLEYTGAHNLVIVEPNIEMALHSLRTFDWRRLLESPPHRPLTVTWVAEDLPPDLTAINLRLNLRFSNIARVDGSYFFQHYPNSFLLRVKTSLLQEMAMTFKGLGYTDDEVKMIRNSYQNLGSDESVMMERSSSARQWPVFIIGSGPSLDGCLDVIRANADHAIIIACGTALPPLLKAGIRPDFFVELENGEPIYDWVSRVNKELDFGDITCLASDTVDGRLKTLFKRTAFFIRPGLASTPIFGGAGAEKHGLSLMHPTVGNTGFSFALATGFRELYFFGLDLGSKRPDRHHAGNSPYETGDDIAYTFDMSISRPGNFGGTVMTDNVMDWGRDIFEFCILDQGRGCKVYNCSDGVFIKGAVPKLPRAVALPKPSTSRQDELQAMMGHWQPYGRERFDAAWNGADLEQSVRQFADEMKAKCTLDHADDPLRFLHAVNNMLSNEHHGAQHAIYRGTLQLATIAGAYFVSHAEGGHNWRAAEIFIDEYTQLLDRIADYVIEVLRGIRETGHYDLPIS